MSASAPSTVWAAVDFAGRSELAAGFHKSLVGLEHLERVRDTFAAARAAGKFDGPDFTDANRKAVDDAVAAFDAADIDRLIETFATFSSCADLPGLPIEHDRDFIRERDLLVSAGLPHKAIRRELRRRGWVLL